MYDLPMNSPKPIFPKGSNRHGPTFKNLAIPKADDITDKAKDNRSCQLLVSKVLSLPRKIIHKTI